MDPPKLLRIGFNRPDEPLRVFLREQDGVLVASFEDFGEAHRWLKEHGYDHSPINGGLWVKR